MAWDEDEDLDQNLAASKRFKADSNVEMVSVPAFAFQPKKEEAWLHQEDVVIQSPEAMQGPNVIGNASDLHIVSQFQSQCKINTLDDHEQQM